MIYFQVQFDARKFSKPADHLMKNVITKLKFILF